MKPKLNISITKASIESFQVNLEDKVPNISVSLGLFTEHGKRVTGYDISTDTWNENKKFKLPPSLIEPILKIMKELEVIAIRHCRDGQLALGDGSNNDPF